MFVIKLILKKKLKSIKIYNVESNIDNQEFFIKSITDSVGNYIQDPRYDNKAQLRIRIDQDPELLAIIYPYFDFDYSNLQNRKDETYYSSLKAKFKEFEIFANSDELFQLEGIQIGYTGGNYYLTQIFIKKAKLN